MWKYLVVPFLWAGLMAQDIQSERESDSDGGLKIPLTRVGGWADVMYLDSTREDLDDYFSVPHFYLYFDTRLHDRWRTMVEFRYLNSPDRVSSNKGSITQLQRAYLEYKQGIPIKFRVGRFYTPAGLWKEKHGMMMVDSSHKPIIEEMGWVPTLSTGVQFLGKKMTGLWEWDYAVFGTVKEGTGDDKGSGYGADLNWTFDERIRFGLFGSDYYNDLRGADSASGKRDAFMGYAEAWLVRDELLVRAEYLRVDRGSQGTADGWYSKVKWRFRPKWFVNHRYDHADDLNLLTRHRINTLTLGYSPLPKVRTRLEFATHKLDATSNASYNEWSAWVGVLFNSH